MEIIKALNFIKKHKTVILLPIICILQFLACFFYNFWIVATIFAVLLLLISDFAHIIYYTLFFQMFSSCGYFSVICTFVSVGVICIKYILGLIKKTEKFYPVPFILTCVICLFCSMHNTTVNAQGVYQGSSLIAALFFIYLIFVYRDRFKLRKCADFLISGILTTAAISFVTILFNTHLSQFVEVFSTIHRLKLLTGNENSLAIYCSLALSVYVSNILTKKDNIYKNIILGLSSIAIGLSTVSKCFLLVCMFILAYLFIVLIIKYKLKSVIFITPIILIITILCLIPNSPIGAIFDRLLTKVNGTLSIYSLTTGRSTLWTIYINEITSSIRKMLIGVGFFSERLVNIGPHNLLIHLFYRMGLIGLLMLGILCYYYYRDSVEDKRKTLKPTLKTSLTLMVFILISMVESFL